jgi:hypothetical protein
MTRHLLMLTAFTSIICLESVLGAPVPQEVDAPPATAIDFERARELNQKLQRNESLSPEEQSYLQRAKEERSKRAELKSNLNANQAKRTMGPAPRDSTGLIPLNELSADQHYKKQDGGLYGGGLNSPPAAHRQAAEQELAKIQTLDANGQPAANGKIVFISISMSNATQEFSRFKQLADIDPDKSDKLTIVDCAQGGQAMAEWATAHAPAWAEAARRLEAAAVSPQQVQVAWIKLANKGPTGDLEDHARLLTRDTQKVLQLAKEKFPNLRIVYLSSRIYGGYATNNLNPEPFAYESAFAVRWLIQEQIRGDASLIYSASQGEVKTPLLLWGPYLWADGTRPRKSDQLSYLREDLANDGTHPSQSGRDKVAQQLLSFLKTDPLAKPWFTR